MERVFFLFFISSLVGTFLSLNHKRDFFQSTLFHSHGCFGLLHLFVVVIILLHLLLLNPPKKEKQMNWSIWGVLKDMLS